ncbi:MAG: Maf family protein [Patescibacteria group bacterium]|nr:Maf family protein [Patescibacteria group bacterium]
MDRKIILASKSPRRKELLERIGLKFEIKVSNFDEDSIPFSDPTEYVEKISQSKAKDVAKDLKDAIIIAADTTIVLDGKIIGKPTSAENAKKILQQLSGRDHLVITGFTILDSKSNVLITKSVKSTVFFKELSEQEIDVYVATGEPLDKAGAYGVQEKAGIFLDRIEGDFFNVVGLPILAVYEELKKFGVVITNFWKPL